MGGSGVHGERLPPAAWGCAVYGGIIKLVALAGRKSELLDFLSWDAEVARTEEPGTLRFDIWEVADEPDVVYLYEAYVDEQAFRTHQESEPFKRFIEHIVPNVIEAPIFVVPFTNATASIADG
jgi:quinol monooxygenase YgiN